MHSRLENRSEEQKRMLWVETQAERQRYVNWANIRIAKALRAQTKLAASAIENAGTIDQIGKAVEHSINHSKPLISEVYHRLYLMIAPVFANHALQSLKASPGQVSSWHRIVSNYLSTEGGAKITQINDETRRRIMTILDDETAKGKSLREIAQMIDSNIILDQIISRRSMVIAHTETVTASNWGSLLGAKNSGASVMKQWIATRDDATRGLRPKDQFDHFHMDDQPKGGLELDELFSVPMRPAGVEQLQFPGDPSGSAGNIINCRCTIGYLRKGYHV